MADKKISQLQAATLPLAGTELLPIVQSGTTDNITVNNLAAGNIKSNATTGVLQVTGPAAASIRVMTTPDANFTAARTDAAQSFTADQTLSTGNLVIGTSGKGIDFSATSDGSGTMTSELLADYEEGTWTPQITSTTPPTTPYTMTIKSATYTKIGRQVTVCAYIGTNSVDTTGASGAVIISGLPFTSAATNFSAVSVGYSNYWNVAFPLFGNIQPNNTFLYLRSRNNGNSIDYDIDVANLTTGVANDKNLLIFTATYFV